MPSYTRCGRTMRVLPTSSRSVCLTAPANSTQKARRRQWTQSTARSSWCGASTTSHTTLNRTCSTGCSGARTSHWTRQPLSSRQQPSFRSSSGSTSRLLIQQRCSRCSRSGTAMCWCDPSSSSSEVAACARCLQLQQQQHAATLPPQCASALASSVCAHQHVFSLEASTHKWELLRNEDCMGGLQMELLRLQQPGSAEPHKASCFCAAYHQGLAAAAAVYRPHPCGHLLHVSRPVLVKVYACRFLSL